MNGTQVKALSAQTWYRIAVRLVTILACAFVIGWTLKQISIVMERSQRPAGFARGILQGALMPMAWPNLLVGKDLTIYSPNNTGVGYKLGYTSGVNCAGVVFFGCFFWRLSRWRRGG
jgi:hypothetical protein